MIREYQDGDIDRINVNKFALINEIKMFIDNPNMHKVVLENNGIKVITCFFEYHPECYDGFFVVSDDIGLNDIKHLRILLKELIMQYKPKRLQTTSEDCPIINKWMEFMGFTKEGTRKKYMYDKDFNMWSILWA